MADEDTILLEDEDLAQENKFLLFKLGGEEYGIDIAKIQSIEEMVKIVGVPDMPNYVKGVINLRGKVIPVIDLRINFDMEEREYDDRTCIIICMIDDKNIGIIVDTVSEVVDVPEKNIEPAPNFKGGKEREEYIAGIGKVGEEVKILLDVSKLLSGQEIEKIQEKAQ